MNSVDGLRSLASLSLSHLQNGNNICSTGCLLRAPIKARHTQHFSHSKSSIQGQSLFPNATPDSNKKGDRQPADQSKKSTNKGLAGSISE